MASAQPLSKEERTGKLIKKVMKNKGIKLKCLIINFEKINKSLASLSFGEGKRERRS